MQDIGFFEGKRSIKKISISFNKGKRQLDCNIWEEWLQIEPTPFTLRCNNRREFKATKRFGFEKTIKNSIETNIGSTIGLKGIASLESSIKNNIDEEVKFEVGEEKTDTYSFSSPECGYLLASLFQKSRRYHFAYRDLRFWHKNSFEFTETEWLKPIYDATISNSYDPNCNCLEKPSVHVTNEGEPCRITINNIFSKLAVYHKDSGQLEFGDNHKSLNEFFTPRQGIWLGKLPSGLIPDYLKFLVGIQIDSLLDAEVVEEQIVSPIIDDLSPREIVNIELGENFEVIPQYATRIREDKADIIRPRRDEDIMTN